MNAFQILKEWVKNVFWIFFIKSGTIGLYWDQMITLKDPFK